MITKRVCILLALAAVAGCCLFPGNVVAQTPEGREGITLHVSKLGNNSDGLSWATAFTTIQAALNAIPDNQGGHRVLVRPDTYMEANLSVPYPGAASAYNHLIGDKTFRWLAYGDDAPLGDIHVQLRIYSVLGVDQPTILDMDIHGVFPAKVLITAMRTATPKVTWGRMTACGPSATEESISTPRFIGPGCITMASGLASASRSCVRP